MISNCNVLQTLLQEEIQEYNELMYMLEMHYGYARLEQVCLSQMKSRRQKAGEGFQEAEIDGAPLVRFDYPIASEDMMCLAAQMFVESIGDKETQHSLRLNHSKTLKTALVALDYKVAKEALCGHTKEREVNKY